jgi:hypothetical protein
MTLSTGLYSHQNKTTGNDPANTPANKAHAEQAGEHIRELLISHIDRTGALPGWLAEKGSSGNYSSPTSTGPALFPGGWQRRATSAIKAASGGKVPISVQASRRE